MSSHRGLSDIARDRRTATRPFAFVLMPFSTEFERLYRESVKPAAATAGMYAERCDEQIHDGDILDRVYNQIAKADIVVAVVDGRNPNVYYEVGYAHALDRIVLLAAAAADEIIFDLQHYPHVIYGGSATTLKEELTRKLVWFTDNPDRQLTAIATDLELLINGVRVCDGVRIEQRASAPLKQPKSAAFCLAVSLHNPSRRVHHGFLQIGVVTSEQFYSQDSIVLPDGRLMHLTSEIERLFPDAWCQVELHLGYKGKHEWRSTSHAMAVRLFLEDGSRDICFNLSLRERILDPAT